MAPWKFSVFVFAEQGQKGIEPVSFQLIGKARQMADAIDGTLGVILLGKNLGDLSRKLIEAGADQVFRGDADILAPYQAELYTEIIVKLMVEHHPDVLLLGSTFTGRELAPSIAGRLETGLTAHCIDLKINHEGILEQQIPAYGGKITIICPERRPQMATVANGVFSTPIMDSTRSGQIIPIAIPESYPLRARTLEIVNEESSDIPLESAAIIVAGGGGAGDLTGWNQISELADALKAGFGSTRPAVDAGWADRETMIGQSGKIVNPKIYIGVGLSGEFQHLVGIIGAKTMIAINNDPKAPIFKQVDYGIVEDCRAFIPAFVNTLKNR